MPRVLRMVSTVSQVGRQLPGESMLNVYVAASCATRSGALTPSTRIEVAEDLDARALSPTSDRREEVLQHTPPELTVDDGAETTRRGKKSRSAQSSSHGGNLRRSRRSRKPTRRRSLGAASSPGVATEVMDTHRGPPLADLDVTSSSRSDQTTDAPKNIDFDDVYQDGNAKHRIIEHPKGSGRWFILQCQRHGMQFGRKPLVAAVRHIYGKLHGLAAESSVAVAELGTQVLHCDADKAERNNKAFREALDSGYKVRPSGLPRVTGATPRNDTASEQPASLLDTSSHNTPRKQKQFQGIADPETGKLYLGRWSTSSASKPAWYAVLVLPLGSFETVGIPGSINDTGLLDGHIPVCYRSGPKRILGWKEGFEDGGSEVNRRKFPVLWFQDDQPLALRRGKFQVPSSSSFSWVSASQLRPFGEYGPDSSPVTGYDVASRFAEELDTLERRQKSSKEVSTTPRGISGGGLPGKALLSSDRR